MLIALLGSCKKDIQSISLDKNTITIEQKQKFNLTATILPSDVTNNNTRRIAVYNWRKCESKIKKHNIFNY